MTGKKVRLAELQERVKEHYGTDFRLEKKHSSSDNRYSWFAVHANGGGIHIAYTLREVRDMLDEERVRWGAASRNN